MKLAKAFVILACVAGALAMKSYDGYKVIRVEVPDKEHGDILHKYESTFDFWTPIRIGKHVDIMIKPEQSQFPNLLQRMGFTITEMLDNLGPLVAEGAQRVAEQREKYFAKQGNFLEVYHTYEEITQFLYDTADTYSTASTEVIGQTYEGRDMTVLKICSGNCGDMPVMYIECGIHAREWLTDAVCLQMINELTANAAANSKYTDNLDWYFLTPANPDGYSYTWTTDRMWRKTRSSNNKTTGADLCDYGTDPNRNFGVHWNEGGASDSTCSETYHGPYAFSEKCTQNIRDFLAAHKDEVVYFMDLHAYSMLAMYPYGWTTEPAADDDALGVLCAAAELAMENTHGETYECGPIATTIYVASGSTVDWAYDNGAKRAFTIETRPRGQLGGGFDPPESEIKPTSEEIWAWHKAVADSILA